MTKVNDKYYVPVEKEGKWELQEWQHGWTPTYNDPDNSGCHPMQEPTGNSYPTLESDSAYWASKEGVKMTEGEFEITLGCYKTHEYSKLGELCLCGNKQCIRIGCKEYAFPVKTQYAIPIQSPTTKELIEQEAERYAYAGSVGKDYFIKGANFALSLPKQDNGDAWDEVEKAASLYANEATPSDIDFYQQAVIWREHYTGYLKQHYSISKIK